MSIKLSKAIILILQAITITSCASRCNYNAKPAIWVQLSHEVSNCAIEQVYREYPVNLSMHGGAMMDRVNRVILGFDICQPLSKDQARIIAIGIEEIILACYNKNEQIRPFLKKHPFDASNINVSLFLKGEQPADQDDWELSYCSICNNSIYYQYENKDNFLITKEESEPYDEAVQIVKGHG